MHLTTKWLADSYLWLVRTNPCNLVERFFSLESWQAFSSRVCINRVDFGLHFEHAFRVVVRLFPFAVICSAKSSNIFLLIFILNQQLWALLLLILLNGNRSTMPTVLLPEQQIVVERTKIQCNRECIYTGGKGKACRIIQHRIQSDRVYAHAFSHCD